MALVGRKFRKAKKRRVRGLLQQGAMASILYIYMDLKYMELHRTRGCLRDDAAPRRCDVHVQADA
eukprot:9247779-Pyramimonas_sp.AAC.1